MAAITRLCHWPVLALALLVVAVGGSACRASKDGTTTPTGPPSLHAPPADGRTVAEQKALDAYRGMWRAYVDALAKADPDDQDLRRYSTGDALTTLVNGVSDAKWQGLVGTGDITTSPQTTSLTPADHPVEAHLTDCVDTSKSVMVKKSGEPYKDTPGGRRLSLATVKDTGSGVWKVTSFGLHGVGSC